MEVFRTGRKLAFSRSVVLPTHRRKIVRHALHRDAVLHRTYGSAQIAPDAGFLDDFNDRPAVVARQAPDRLMRAVLARGPAQLALDAFVLVDVREQMVVEIEVFPLGAARERAATDVRERAVSPLVHPVR